ncbi:hypothetical protein AB0M46_05680 [Dactylosporangium sp. NPDC051485]|uniref:hypothetical protein n=1 Tax=Dactylosporangium sp. NPDC051485 TaxID=3154846 RepID=UPI0034386805
MLTKPIRGHECTDRAGVAELLGRGIQTVKYLAADRATTGFPQPFDVELTGRGVRTNADGTKTGREWYRVDQILEFKTEYLTRVAEAGQPRSHGAKLEGDPAELLDPAAFAAFLRIGGGTFSRYVNDSKATWHAYWTAARHATLDGNQLVVHATADSGRFLVTDDGETFELDTDVHDAFARHGGVWQPTLPGYTFPGDAREALTILLAGDDFYLPPPDERQHGRGGIHRRWRGDTAQTFADKRDGSAAWPRRRRRRTPQAP